MFSLFGLHSMMTGFERPKVSDIPLLKALVAVPVSASTGTEENNFVRNPIFAYAGLNVDLRIENKFIS